MSWTSLHTGGFRGFAPHLLAPAQPLKKNSPPAASTRNNYQQLYIYIYLYPSSTRILAANCQTLVARPEKTSIARVKMIAMRVLLTINQQQTDVSEKNRVIFPSIPSFVIPSQNCHNMKGHLSFCKHKPAGFLRKFGLTVFSILIVWTHTACFLFILTDTSTYFHHLGLFHLSGSKPLDSRSLSRKN